MPKSTTHQGTSAGWRQLLHNRNVRWLFAGQTISQVGDGMARVFGLFNTGTMVSAMIGMTLFGWVADRFGPGISLAVIGLVNGVTAIVSMVLLPACYRLAKQPVSHPAQSLRRAS